MGNDCNVCRRLIACKNGLQKDEFMRHVAIALCDMVASSESTEATIVNIEALIGALAGTTPYVPLPVVRIAAGDLLTTYDVTNALVDAHDKVYISVANYTNETVIVSLDDGVSDYEVLPQSTAFILRSGDLNRTFGFNVYVRLDTTTTDEGEVVISSGY